MAGFILNFAYVQTRLPYALYELNCALYLQVLYDYDQFNVFQ